jgi:hypothetical protein
VDEIEPLRRDRVGAMKSLCRSFRKAAENMGRPDSVSKRSAASAICKAFLFPLINERILIRDLFEKGLNSSSA